MSLDGPGFRSKKHWGAVSDPTRRLRAPCAHKKTVLSPIEDLRCKNVADRLGLRKGQQVITIGPWAGSAPRTGQPIERGPTQTFVWPVLSRSTGSELQPAHAFGHYSQAQAKQNR